MNQEVRSQPRCPRCLAVALSLAVLLGSQRARGDWPQVLGPQRDAVASPSQPWVAWPATGPEQLWSTELGMGYAGPAIAGRRVIVFHRRGDRELLSAFDTVDGHRLWEAEFPATYVGGIDPDTGPRAVPLIHQQTVYAWGAAGSCHAVDLASGAVRWSRDLAAELDAPDGYFGFASSPIVAGQLLVLNVGAPGGAGIIALRLTDGTTAWQATDELASYSSPVPHRLAAGQLVFVTRMKMLSIEAATGREVAAIDFGKRGPTVNAASPVWAGDQLFLSASYGIGARMLRWRGAVQGAARPAWETAWEGVDILASQYNTPVYFQGHLYGIHGREDAGPAELRCVAAADGAVQWRQPDFGVAHLVRIGQTLLALQVTGQLVALQAGPERFESLAAARVSDHDTRALPAVSDGRLFLRDNQGRSGGSLRVFQLTR